MRWRALTAHEGNRDSELALRSHTEVSQPQHTDMSEEEDEEPATPQTTGSSHRIGPCHSVPPLGESSNWWKGQPVRSHTQISLRTSEATCQLLPIVGLIIEMWTVVHMEYD